MTVWTIVVAAGQGDRFGGDKLVANLSGRPVLVHSVAAASKVSDGVVVVTAASRQPAVADLMRGFDLVPKVVPGGSTRSSSVRAGLAAVPETAPPAPEQPPVAAPGSTVLTVAVPAGAQPGQQIQIKAPDGRVVTVAIPAGLQPGQQFQIKV